MQPDPSAPATARAVSRVLRRRSFRVLGLAATGALTAVLATSSVTPAAGTPVLPALPVNADLLGATGALPAETAPVDPTVFVPVGASGPTFGAATLHLATAPPKGGTPVPAVGPDHLGIPARVLAAYQRAEATMTKDGPGCHLRWWVLAGIGRIEASHAEDGRLDAHGVAVPPIFGPVLNGQPGMAAVRDTDGGHLDADPVWDRAVGPMQFLPGSWLVYGAGGNPQNVDDAALAAARYLCAGGADLSVAPRLVSAIFNYNHSDAYVADVLGWAHAYERGVTATPAGPAVAQFVRRATPAKPSATSAALQALAAPARVLPAPARSRTPAPAGAAKPAGSPGRSKPVTPTTAAAPAGGPATTGTATASAPVTTGAAPASGPATTGTAPASQPVPPTPLAPSAPATATPAGGSTTAAPCPAAQVTPTTPAPPATTSPAPPAGTPAPAVGQPGPVTDTGTISAITCTLATLTRSDGTLRTVELSLLPHLPAVGARVQFTGSLSPDGRVLLATTMAPAP